MFSEMTYKKFTLEVNNFIQRFWYVLDVSGSYGLPESKGKPAYFPLYTNYLNN